MISAMSNLNRVGNGKPADEGHRRIELLCRGARIFQLSQQPDHAKMVRKNPIEPTRMVT